MSINPFNKLVIISDIESRRMKEAMSIKESTCRRSSNIKLDRIKSELDRIKRGLDRIISKLDRNKPELDRITT